YRDPGPHLQQDLQPGLEGRLWDLTRGTHRSDLVPERQSRLRLGQLQSTPAGTDPRRWELPDACGAAHRDVSPEVRDLPVGLGGVARPDGFGGSLDSSRGGVVRLDDRTRRPRHRLRRTAVPTLRPRGRDLRAG